MWQLFLICFQFVSCTFPFFLEVIKSASTTRVPDCFQRTPRRIQIPESSGQILTIAVDGQGIHAIVRSGAKLSYVIYNVSSGRVEQDNPFPSDTTAFMGLHPSLINLTCAGEVSKFYVWFIKKKKNKDKI